MMLKATLVIGATCLALAGVASAQTADGEDSSDARVQELEERLDRLEAAGPAQIDPVRANLGNGRPTIQADDARFSVRGLVQFDAAAYDQDGVGPQDFDSGTNFRRARLGVAGRAYSWNYELTFEFVGSGTEDPGRVLAGWIEYGGFGRWRVRVGAQAPSAGLDDSTSATDIPFLERGAAAETARGIAAGDGRVAIAATNSGNRWFGSLAATGDVAGADTSYDEQLGFVGRIAVAPVLTEAFALHLGFNHSDVSHLADASAGAGVDWAQLRGRPELRVDGARLVDTGQLTAEAISATGVEAGAQWGPLYVSSEYIVFDVDRAGALPDAEFEGWHVQAAWSLTGERRRWSKKNGAFASERVAAPFNPYEGHWGAWELAGRWSVLDLNDNETSAGAASTLGAPTAIVRGGAQEIATLGLNWRPNAMLRFMLNYQSTDIERYDAAGLIDIGQSFEAVSLRSQLSF
jgi:phosphate-selective porin OprO/OprP